ncbi:lycopene beta cyclase chloroplast precursor [Tribonema minus]|uniref:lycopene beta-cyclase n=1 Tax=Tribonema minus TaxID=303371 RepID=A0A835YM92_9STRA|nr:lycopene beta cyclase chloroplast precursor [Tribonema minus]
MSWGQKPSGGAPSQQQDLKKKLKEPFDVAVIGSGPGGSVMATMLAEKHGLRVAVIDPALERGWVPNYGVWLEEWEALDRLLDIGLGACLSRTWSVTDCFYGQSHGVPEGERLRIERPYARVARHAMRETLRDRMIRAGAVRIQGGVDAETVQHTATGSTFKLDTGDVVTARMILDCSGHNTKLVERQGPHDPGFQIAYGMECDVKDDLGPYDPDAMLFMDYRTSFAPAARQQRLRAVPTFLYAMPLGRSGSGGGGAQRVFFEETSLVARPPMAIEECKERLYERLAHHGIEVTKVHEEEFCVIPMGGSLPKFDQRVVGFAGAGGLVHASTGYMQVRMLAAAKPAADAIGRAFAAAGADRANFNPDAAARRAYLAIWPAAARVQRDFHMFGGEFLMQQDVEALRGFFNAFFKVPLPYWAGFLSGYPGLPHNEMHQSWGQRFLFGVQLWLYAPVPVKVALAVDAIKTGLQLGLVKSVTPLSDAEYDKDAALEAALSAMESASSAAAKSAGKAAPRELVES